MGVNIPTKNSTFNDEKTIILYASAEICHGMCQGTQTDSLSDKTGEMVNEFSGTVSHSDYVRVDERVKRWLRPSTSF